MARGFTLTRSRSTRLKDVDSKSPRDSPRIDGSISQPVFIATDAQPRDDLYTLRSNHVSNSNPGQRPRTASSPHRQPSQTQSPQLLQAQSSPIASLALGIPRQSHVVYDAEGRQQEVEIGMALGSPSQNPLPPLPKQASLDDNYHKLSPQTSATEERTYQGKDAYKQKGKWKGFGGLFSKKSASMPVSPASPLYATQTTAQGNTHRKIRPHTLSHGSHSAYQANMPTMHKEVAQDSPRQFKMPVSKYSNLKPDMHRSHTTPMFQTEQHTPTPPPPPKDDLYEGPPVQAPVATTSLLEVEIPNVTMDRYSVMFGSVLQPKQPSLLVRRQAQLDKLKNLDEELKQRQREIEKLQKQIRIDKAVDENVKSLKTTNEKVKSEGNVSTAITWLCRLDSANTPQEDTNRLEESSLRVPARGPSPVPRTKSPSFSLFPSTPTVRIRNQSPQAFRKPAPIQRSATAPISSQSPLKANFEIKHTGSKDQSAVLVMVHSPSQSVNSPASSHHPKWSSDLSPTSTEASLPSESDFLSVDKDSSLVAPETRRLLEARKQAIAASSDNDMTLTNKVFEFPSQTQRASPRRIRLTDSPERAPQQAPQLISNKTAKQAPSTPSLQQSPSKAPPTPGLQRTASLTKGQPIQGPLKFTQIKPIHAAPSSPHSNFTSAHHNAVTPASKSAKTHTEFAHIVNGNPLASSPPSAAEISIARQISVSKRQRQLLVPIVPKTTKQPMQPKLVNVEGVSRHASRKSHHVLVESD